MLISNSGDFVYFILFLPPCSFYKSWYFYNSSFYSGVVYNDALVDILPFFVKCILVDSSSNYYCIVNSGYCYFIKFNYVLYSFKINFCLYVLYSDSFNITSPSMFLRSLYKKSSFSCGVNLSYIFAFFCFSILYSAISLSRSYYYIYSYVESFIYS